MHLLPGFSDLLLDWFSRNARPLPWRQGYDPYQVWLSEVMLQQTQMERAVGYFERFLARFPDLPSLARADEAAWAEERAGVLLYP